MIYFDTDVLVTTYGIEEFNRAKELAIKVGFNNINDCLHIAIAEKHCRELYTFNKEDFTRLQKHTSLPIHIL